MANFTATAPWSDSAFNNTEIYEFSAASGFTVMPWISLSYTITQTFKVFRGAQVKVWNGTAWTLAPPS